MLGRRCLGSVLVGIVIASCAPESDDGLFGGAPGSGGEAGDTGSPDRGGRAGMGGRASAGSGGSGGSSGGTSEIGGESGMDSGGAGDGGAAPSGGTSSGGTATGGTNGGQSPTAGAPAGGSGGTISAGGSSTGGVKPTGGSAALCGGIECNAGQECCGSRECGYCINPNTDPACATECPQRACGNEGLRCLDRVLGYPGELCIRIEISKGPTSEQSWACRRNPCQSGTTDCDCAGDLCEEVSPATQCAESSTEEDLLCIGGGPCNSPDTPIATPSGDRAIATLRPGELVYSIDRDALRAVPIRWIARTAVERHRVVRLVLETGIVLEISPGHPLSDGRSVGQLEPGHSLDGVEIVSRDLVDYGYTHTYDILPDSDSGSYVVAGLVLGSTLGR